MSVIERNESGKSVMQRRKGRNLEKLEISQGNKVKIFCASIKLILGMVSIASSFPLDGIIQPKKNHEYVENTNDTIKKECVGEIFTDTTRPVQNRNASASP